MVSRHNEKQEAGLQGLIRIEKALVEFDICNHEIMKVRGAEHKIHIG